MSSSHAVAAFITFNNQESALRCVEDYSPSNSWLSPLYWCQPTPLRLRGKRISVVQAPDPSQVRAGGRKEGRKEGREGESHGGQATMGR